jgi:hypothetical protein
VKGTQDKNGTDNLEVLLINNGGHDKRTIEGAQLRVERYGMERYPRVRFDSNEYDAEVAAAFGQYNYGKVVINKEGILVGIDVRGNTFTSVVEESCGTVAPEFPWEGFGLKVRTTDLSGGTGGIFDTSDKLKTDMTGNIELQFKLPEGWHVSGGTGDTPKVSVAYSGAVEVGPLEAWSPSEENPNPPLRLSLKAPKGTPIGRYLIHGTIRFVVCDDDGCLPPVELPWDVVLEAL